MSPDFVHCMSLIFELILLRRKFWGIPLRRNKEELEEEKEEKEEDKEEENY